MLNEDTVAGAALNGHLAVVKYLRTLYISWDSDTCNNAALNGHLVLLKWVRAHHCHGINGLVPMLLRMVTLNC
jgi:hypothetical protein